jgi:hypothetical protein
MSDIRQTSIAVQRLVGRISMVTNQRNNLLILLQWQQMNATMETTGF